MCVMCESVSDTHGGQRPVLCVILGCFSFFWFFETESPMEAGGH